MSSHQRLPERWRRALGGGSTLLVLPRAALLALTVAFGLAGVAGVGIGLRTQMAVYLLGMVGLNLPHGGYEHLRNLRRRRVDFRWRYLARYLALVGATVGLYLLAPVAGVTLLFCVAMAKGGLGDLRVMAATGGTDHLRTDRQRRLAAAVRGGAVMVVPAVAWPETFYAFASLMVGLVDPGALAAHARAFDAVRLGAGGLYAAGLLAHLALGYRRGGGHSWLVDAGESLLLVAYFALVPVVVAVGLYFPFWYSARQVARTATIEREPAAEDAPDLLSGQRTPTALRAWAVLVGGALLAAALLGALYVAVPNPLPGASLLSSAVALWTVFISIVALPHVVVGDVLDRERGIWYVP